MQRYHVEYRGLTEVRKCQMHVSGDGRVLLSPAIIVLAWSVDSMSLNRVNGVFRIVSRKREHLALSVV